MEFLGRYRNLLVLLILLLAQIIGLAMQVKKNATGRVGYDPGDTTGTRVIRLWASWIVSPPERTVQFFKHGVGGVWGDYFNLRHVRQENQDLQATIDRLRLEQAALLEDARQGQRLQADLRFQQKYIYKTVLAQIIGTSGSDQSKVFYIDKGKDDGLARDMAVISADGVVGKVREVFRNDTAQVLAINDQTSGAGVILESTRIRGILRGNSNGRLQIVGVLADNRIKPGEKVLTAGGDQIFPRGLPVGEVEKIVNDPDRDGFIEIIVNPAAHLNELDEVMVITSTEDRFNAQQSQDIAASQALKGADAAELAEQRKASAIMAERLPGLTDPNAPVSGQPGANGQPAANGQSAPGAAPGAGATIAPVKILPPAHTDRFSPGNAPGPPDSAGPQHPTERQQQLDTPRRNPSRPEINTNQPKMSTPPPPKNPNPNEVPR
jgi:rod shape-determining protein MreC